VPRGRRARETEATPRPRTRPNAVAARSRARDERLSPWHRRAHASCPSRVDVRRVAAAFTSPCCAAVASVSPVSFRPAAWRARQPVVQAPPVPSFVRVHRIVVVLPAAPASPWLRRTAVVSPALSIPRTSRTRLIEAIPAYLTAFGSTRKCSHRSFVAYHRITSELSVTFSSQPSSSSRRRESFRLLRSKSTPSMYTAPLVQSEASTVRAGTFALRIGWHRRGVRTQRGGAPAIADRAIGSARASQRPAARDRAAIARSMPRNTSRWSGKIRYQ
jgi:hypothetical protein